MYILISLVLLLLSAAIIAVLRMTRPSAPYVWLAAAGGGLATWASVLLWQFGMPWQYMLGQWSPPTLFSASPELLANPFAWVYALSLSAVAAAVILTSPVRVSQTTLASWLGILGISALGLVAVLVDNPLALVLAWMAIDLAEFVIVMRTRPSAAPSRAAVLAFSLRAAGTVLVMWAGVLGAAAGKAFLLEAAPQPVGIFLVLAAGLRLAVRPPHLVYTDEPSVQRSFGTLLQMTVAATSLMLLTRLPAGAVDSRWLLPLLLWSALAALYGGWKWFSAPDELSGRPYWIIGLGALALAATLSGNPAGAGAWGATLILFGGISFLYSSKQIWFTRTFALLGILMLGLPFTLTASGWSTDLPASWLLWPMLLIGLALLAGGYVRHLARPGETKLDELPSWAQAIYPVGMGVLVLTILLLGLWGWPGALDPGVWQAGALAALLYIAAAILVLRLPRLAAGEAIALRTRRRPNVLALLGIFPRLGLALYRLVTELLLYVSGLLEGDGGLLWTLLLLVLLTIFLRGR